MQKLSTKLKNIFRNKITPRIKTEFANRAEKAGLDGKGRFPTIGRAINIINGILEKPYTLSDGTQVSIELDDITSADLFVKSPAPALSISPLKLLTLFSPDPIGNSMLAMSWHYIKERDNYEVLAYLS